MTKTELLEQILAELKAIHALVGTPADLPTPAQRRCVMCGALAVWQEEHGWVCDKHSSMPAISDDKAERY